MILTILIGVFALCNFLAFQQGFNYSLQRFTSLDDVNNKHPLEMFRINFNIFFQRLKMKSRSYI